MHRFFAAKLVHRRERRKKKNDAVDSRLSNMGVNELNEHHSRFVLSIYLFLCVEDVLDVSVFHVVSEKGLLKLNVP